MGKGALSLTASFCRGMNAMTLEKAFCSWFSCLFSECSHNLGVCRGQWFQHAVLPWSRYSHYSSRLVLSPPRLPTSFTLSNICKWVAEHAHLHNYVGESKRSWKSWGAEHKPGTNGNISSAVKQHAETTGHNIHQNYAHTFWKQARKPGTKDFF